MAEQCSQQKSSREVVSGEARQEWAEQEFTLCVYISVYKYFLVVVGKNKDGLLYNHTDLCKVVAICL